MKQQYARNKELEKMLSDDQSLPDQSQMQEMLAQYRQREEHLEREAEIYRRQIDSLQSQLNSQMTRQSASALLVSQIEQMQDEVKRTHAKYIDMRQFAYSQIEALVRQLNAAKRG